MPGGKHRGKPVGHHDRHHQQRDEQGGQQKIGILDRRPLGPTARQHEFQQIAAIDQG
jgi:hypothetical protein